MVYELRAWFAMIPYFSVLYSIPLAFLADCCSLFINRNYSLIILSLPTTLTASLAASLALSQLDDAFSAAAAPPSCGVFLKAHMQYSALY